MNPTRRLLVVLWAALLAGCTGMAPRDAHPPIVFVHGNGDTAALWYPTVWRFESNGWPRERVFAVDLPYPLARTEDTKPQPGRSSADENTRNLAAEIERVRKLTGADKVVLVGNSRGSNAIRDFIRNGGGATTVSRTVLGGGPNHGVFSSDDFLPGSEFNGKSPFMTALNAPQGPDRLETTPGVDFMTLRSDSNDKFTQPDGRWIGQPKMATNASHDGPALRGAENIVLPGLDHREVSFHPIAFAHTWRFLTGQFPRRTDVAAEANVTLDGRITGFLGASQTNLPLAGASIDIYETSPQTGERLGGAVHAKTVGADGQWGPFRAKPDASYEFVIRADGFAITHIYRSPFPRSSSFVHLRPARIADADKDAASVVIMRRPRGYLGAGRDRMSLDGKNPPGIAPGVPGTDSSKLKLMESAVRAVAAEFNDEKIVVRSWPLKDNRLVFAEFHY